MKYIVQIQIALPRDEVIKKLDNPDNMKHWQRGLIGFTLLEGTPGEVGSTMELNYLMGKRKMTMIETITKNDFPNEFHATYHTQGVLNFQENYFRENDYGTTEWISHSEFQFKGFGMKLVGWLFPSAFKKQSLKYLTDFKNFAEKGTSVLNDG